MIDYRPFLLLDIFICKDFPFHGKKIIMKQSKIIVYVLFILIFFLPFTHAEQAEIRILHINDFHGFAEPYKPLGSDLMLGGLP